MTGERGSNQGDLVFSDEREEQQTKRGEKEWSNIGGGN